MWRLILPALLLPLTAASVLAQNPLLDKFEEAREAAKSLAAYPKEVREAMLEVSQHPELVTKLESAKGAALTKALAAYPADVRKAGNLLAQYPEVLTVMKDHPRLTAAVGKFYSQRKDEIRKFLDKEEKQESDAADAWAKRLEENEKALEELKAAVEAYAKQTGASVPGSVATAPEYGAAYYFGGYYAAPTATYVYGLPYGAFAGWVMANADEYAALADEFVDQWLTSQNADDFEQAMSNWWQNHEAYYPEGLLDNVDGSRQQRLSELAQFDRKNPNNKPQPRDLSQNQKLLNNKKGDYPELSRFAGGPKAKPTSAPAGKGPTAGKGPAPTGKGPGAAPKKGQQAKAQPKTAGARPKQQSQVQRKQPNHKQQVSRAAGQQKASWNKPQQPRGGAAKSKPRPSGGGRGR